MNGFSAKIGSIVPLGRDYFPHDPRHSCLATIVLSLRDKIHSTAEALLKLALMGFQPWEAFNLALRPYKGASSRGPVPRGNPGETLG